MKTLQKVSVFGLGKLGACIAATLASRGFDVLGVDIDPEKVRLVNEGLPPVEEPLLAQTVEAGKSRLRATTNPGDAVQTDVSFFIPPSPSLPDGSFSNEFLLRAMQQAARAVGTAGKKGHLFVCSSTTTPGAMDSVLIPMLEKETGWKCGQDFGVCYNPEFIALGNVVNGLLEPDMVLIGDNMSMSLVDSDENPVTLRTLDDMDVLWKPGRLSLAGKREPGTPGNQRNKQWHVNVGSTR
ncbi:MAG: 3-hydroxyacyl-CoA dehydrogenase NAD-binding domain-containing protein, partial [Limisphaerales bacterium]